MIIRASVMYAVLSCRAHDRSNFFCLLFFIFLAKEYSYLETVVASGTADCVLAFWDGSSRGTKFVIENCEKSGKPVTVIVRQP